VKDLPLAERPRERLLRLGASALSNVELIALILGEGVSGKSALDVAAEILAHFRDLESLYGASMEELIAFGGMGVAKAARLKAALTLSSGLNRLPKQAKKYYTADPADIFSYVVEDFLGKDVEILLMVYLDARCRAFQKEVIGIGTLTELLLDPREIFYRAIKRRADQFILVHNHPSGDPYPSDEDIRVSKIVLNISCMMQCKMKDHIIIAGDSYYSIGHLL
jgi:DNA repair protein RadC